jgi:hypothetical protein
LIIISCEITYDDYTFEHTISNGEDFLPKIEGKWRKFGENKYGTLQISYLQNKNILYFK